MAVKSHRYLINLEVSKDYTIIDLAIKFKTTKLSP